MAATVPVTEPIEPTFAEMVFAHLEKRWAEDDRRKAAAKRQEAANNAK